MRHGRRTPARVAIRCATMLAFCAYAVLLWPGQSAAHKPDGLGKFDVGHMRFTMNLIGAVGEARPVDVEVWYPASKKDFENAPLAIYRSRFHGVTLIPSKWDPLSWELVSPLAREGAPIDDTGPAFPVVVFSHGSGASTSRATATSSPPPGTRVTTRTKPARISSTSRTAAPASCPAWTAG